MTRVFRNDGGTLVQVPVAMPLFTAGGLTWGDFNNDGRLDLAGVTLDAGTANVYSGILRTTAGALVY